MITVIGTGTGIELTRHARTVLASATLVVGAARHLRAAFAAPNGPPAEPPPGVPTPAPCTPRPYRPPKSAAPTSPTTPTTDAADDAASAAAARLGGSRVVLGPLAPALEAIEQHLAEVGDRARVAVLASGDPGFFGIVRALADRFGPRQLEIHPASPSVAVAFARLGLPWDDAVVVSAHGRDPRTAVNVCRAHPKAAVLTGPGAGPAELGAALAAAGVHRTLVVAAALGTPDESVEHISPEEAAVRDWGRGPVSIVLCLDERRLRSDRRRTVAGPPPAPAGWALPEQEFAHRGSMVTKYEVRALALARLGPRTGDLIWDIGAGSGSVAVECARFGAAAIAVERTADGVERIRANAAAHGVDIQVVQGNAPAVLDRLPDPDAVFIGGGGADLPAIVATAARRVRRTVVVTLAALDRVPAVRWALSAAHLRFDGTLLQSSRLAPLPGDVTRLAATNPVFVLWGTREVQDGREAQRAGEPRQGAPGAVRGKPRLRVLRDAQETAQKRSHGASDAKDTDVKDTDAKDTSEGAST